MEWSKLWPHIKLVELVGDCGGVCILTPAICTFQISDFRGLGECGSWESGLSVAVCIVLVFAARSRSSQ